MDYIINHILINNTLFHQIIQTSVTIKVAYWQTHSEYRICIITKSLSVKEITKTSYNLSCKQRKSCSISHKLNIDFLFLTENYGSYNTSYNSTIYSKTTLSNINHIKKGLPNSFTWLNIAI